MYSFPSFRKRSLPHILMYDAIFRLQISVALPPTMPISLCPITSSPSIGSRHNRPREHQHYPYCGLQCPLSSSSIRFNRWVVRWLISAALSVSSSSSPNRNSSAASITVGQLPNRSLSKGKSDYNRLCNSSSDLAHIYSNYIVLTT
jgi:hypothetical protein